jgi:hypothetical protein
MTDDDPKRETRRTQRVDEGRVVSFRVEFRRASPRPPGMSERLEKLFRQIAQRTYAVRQAA